MNFNVDKGLHVRFFDHAKLGLAKNVHLENSSYEHRPNLIEKAGNGLLFVVGSIPRSVKWVGKQCQDPRVVTVVLTLSALFLTTLAFYPATGVAAAKATITAIQLALGKIPLWSVKFAGYIVSCATIAGFGARATGRFANADLMKTFYGLPKEHPGNPANMTINEIRRALAQTEASEQVS